MGNVARFCVATVSGVALATASMAFTAGNSVPDSKSGQSTIGSTLAMSLPPECAGMDITSLVTGSGSISGGSAADLLLGSPGIDSLKSGSGNDCLVGGDGIDAFDGGSGNGDVCIGGPGIDTFKNCETIYQ